METDRDVAVAGAIFVENPPRNSDNFKMCMATAGVRVTVGKHVLMDGPLLHFVGNIGRFLMPAKLKNKRIRARLFLLPKLRAPKLKLVLLGETADSVTIDKFSVKRGVKWEGFTW